MRKMTLANRITLARLILTPVVIILLVRQERVWPLLIFIAAVLTDVVDGAVARSRNEQTLLGKFLDPIADKLLLSSSFLALAHLDLLPMWVFIVVFSRDLLILLGWNVLYILTKSVMIAPRWLGKATTFLQMAAVILCLLFPNHPLTGFWLWPMIAATALSTVDYVWIGARKLSELG